MGNRIGYLCDRVAKSLSFRFGFLIYRIRFRFVRHRVCKFHVESIDNTIRKIYEDQVSVSRFGNGEFGWICGIKYDEFESLSGSMSLRLKEVLQVPVPGHIVAIPPVLADKAYRSYDRSSKRFWEYILGKDGDKWIEYLDDKKAYFNPFISRPYISDLNNVRAKKAFDGMKSIWNNRSVLVVEGPYGRMGVGNNLLINARNIKRIIAPARNAFKKYDEIFKVITKYRDELVLISLGPTATILAYDLAKIGIWAIDIGQIDIEYEWYLRGAKKKVPIKGKYVNEAGGMGAFVEFDDDILEMYKKEIIEKIE